MARIALLIVVILATLWMVTPQIHWSGTEIGFAPGSPDPNIYQTTYSFGWPLTWISWERSWNEAEGYDEAGLDSFHVFSFAIHILAILSPMLLIYWLSCPGKRATPNLPEASPQG